jgi:gluconate 2-dehydrogenase gamma chain
MRNSGISRRKLLAGSAVLGTALAVGQKTEARPITEEIPWQAGQANAPSSDEFARFLTADETRFIDAAVSRLIPADDLGPGAVEAGVTGFIDRQLAGPFGRAATWYMQGPWPKGTETQGFQSRMTPAETYRAAIKAIDDYSRQGYSGKAFADLGDDDRDAVLKKLESGEAKLQGVDAKSFFTMFLQNTIEGFFSDPIYGGNRDMAGWRLIGFPGARYDNRPYVDKHNQKLDLPPVGLKGRPGWVPQA